MWIFLSKRIGQSILTIFGVITISFFLVRLSGDPAIMLAGSDASDADIEALREALGLNQPLLVQYGQFIFDAIRGDFGNSLRQAVPAMDLVIERLPATIELALAAFVFGIGAALIIGTIMRLTKAAWLREILMLLALGRQAIPVFSFGLMMILIFAIWLRWLPALGRGGWEHLVLPAITLGSYELALYLRLFNSSLATEQRQDYVRLAYAKGQSRLAIILRHMLPNALLPIITVAGINLGLLLGGAVVTETVFSWPGLGRLIVQSVIQRDFPVIIAGVFILSLIFVAINLIVDVLYAILDPRVVLK